MYSIHGYIYIYIHIIHIYIYTKIHFFNIVVAEIWVQAGGAEITPTAPGSRYR